MVGILKKSTKIVLIGDYNQLPSVGPGQVLKDIIDSKYDEIKVLKDQLKEYQHVSMQLEELKNENNN